MAYFAVMNGNKVENIIVGDDKETLERILNVVLIEYTKETAVGTGYTYDAETHTFIPPATDTVVEEPVIESTEE